MTQWVCIIPAGDACTVQEADVAEAKVMRVDQLDAWARLEAARREYERLQAELGIPLEAPRVAHVQVHSAEELHVKPALHVVGEEEHRAFKVPGPRFACVCNNVYDHAEDLKAHRARCGVAARHKNLDGHAEPDQFKWGLT
jgi:hypothetical protein